MASSESDVSDYSGSDEELIEQIGLVKQRKRELKAHKHQDRLKEQKKEKLWAKLEVLERRCTAAGLPRGGRPITIYGTHLDSGYNPTMTLHTYRRIHDPYSFAPATESRDCTRPNSTMLICISPPSNIPKSYLISNRKKRSVFLEKNYYLNDADMDVYIGVIIGGYTVDLESTLLKADQRTMYISNSPEYEIFPNKIFELKFYEEPGNPHINIVGKRMTHAADASDYTVTVGGAPCIVTKLYAGSLECTPPNKEDIPADGAVDNDGNPRVAIRVFNDENFNPGVARYLYTTPVDTYSIVGGVLGAIGAILIFLVVLVIWKLKYDNDRHKEREKILSEQYTNLIKDEQSMLDCVSKELRKKMEACKLNSDSVSRSREIGQGNFGTVFLGRMSTKAGKNANYVKEYDVAIKTVKDEGVTLRQLEDFLEEATLMKDFDHKNVLKLIGITIEKDRPFVVLPYMANGDLKGYVSKDDRNFKVFDLLKLLIQIADGMEYVSKKGVVHRDLRACNCMVDSKVVVKVGDFGLARWSEGDYYKVNDQERPLPVKWMAPECLQGSKFSSFSDVWAYGIVMWEVLTRGLKPFADVDNTRMREHVLRGGRPPKPAYCPDEVYFNIMLKCWEREHRRRPAFEKLSAMIQVFMSSQDELLREPTRTGTMAGLALDKDPGDYADQIRSRTETNEYRKKPGPTPDYLEVLSSEAHFSVPACKSGSSTTTTTHTNAAFEGEQTPHKKRYENEDYLQPSLRREATDDVEKPEEVVKEKPVTAPSDDYVEPNAPSGEGDEPSSVVSTPYFVNPPIGDDYISGSGHDKLANSIHMPRGELYITSNKLAMEQDLDADKPTEEPHHDDTTPLEGTVQDDRGGINADPDYVNKGSGEHDLKEPDYINEKKRISRGSKKLSITHKVGRGRHTEERGSGGGVRALAAKFGGGAVPKYTSDYANQPSHAKRVPKQRESASEKDVIINMANGNAGTGDTEPTYLTLVE